MYILRFIFLITLIISCSCDAGYDLHITKKDFFFSDGACITNKEWKTYLENDTSIKRDPKNTDDDYLVSIEGQVFPLWYDKEACNLYTKNPTLEAIQKLIEISIALQASVQGDDGEIYLSPVNIIRR